MTRAATTVRGQRVDQAMSVFTAGDDITRSPRRYTYESRKTLAVGTL